MLYGDEEIIRARVFEQSKSRHTIKNEVEIDGVKYVFIEHCFLDIFRMIIPTSFVDMPFERARVKYISDNRPTIILTNSDGSVNITLSHVKSTNEPLYERVNKFRSVVKKLNPANVFFTKHIIETNKITIGYYDFRSPSLGEDIYNIHVIFDIGEMEMFLGFNCPVSVQKQWKPLMLEMIETIKKIEEEAYPCASAP